MRRLSPQELEKFFQDRETSACPDLEKAKEIAHQLIYNKLGDGFAATYSRRTPENERVQAFPEGSDLFKECAAYFQDRVFAFTGSDRHHEEMVKEICFEALTDPEASYTCRGWGAGVRFFARRAASRVRLLIKAPVLESLDRLLLEGWEPSASSASAAEGTPSFPRPNPKQLDYREQLRLLCEQDLNDWREGRGEYAVRDAHGPRRCRWVVLEMLHNDHEANYSWVQIISALRDVWQIVDATGCPLHQVGARLAALPHWSSTSAPDLRRPRHPAYVWPALRDRSGLRCLPPWLPSAPEATECVQGWFPDVRSEDVFSEAARLRQEHSMQRARIEAQLRTMRQARGQSVRRAAKDRGTPPTRA